MDKWDFLSFHKQKGRKEVRCRCNDKIGLRYWYRSTNFKSVYNPRPQNGTRHRPRRREVGSIPSGKGIRRFRLGQRGTHWHCHENKGMWLGFRNAVSGRFIGNNGTGKHWRFICTAEEHDEWEKFMTRPHPDGGHLLLVKHGNCNLPMRGADNGELVVERDTNAGTGWEFIKVDL